MVILSRKLTLYGSLNIADSVLTLILHVLRSYVTTFLNLLYIFLTDRNSGKNHSKRKARKPKTFLKRHSNWSEIGGFSD